MPYVPLHARVRLAETEEPLDAGELNYQITELISRYINLNELRYQTINDVVGALEGAKAEFQRRVVGPYEDRKRQQNGDVYPEWMTS